MCIFFKYVYVSQIQSFFNFANDVGPFQSHLSSDVWQLDICSIFMLLIDVNEADTDVNADAFLYLVNGMYALHVLAQTYRLLLLILISIEMRAKPCTMKLSIYTEILWSRP